MKHQKCSCMQSRPGAITKCPLPDDPEIDMRKYGLCVDFALKDSKKILRRFNLPTSYSVSVFEFSGIQECWFAYYVARSQFDKTGANIAINTKIPGVALAANIEDGVTVEEIVRDSFLHEYGHILYEYLESCPSAETWKRFKDCEHYAESFAAALSGGYDIPDIYDSIHEYNEFARYDGVGMGSGLEFRARGINPAYYGRKEHSEELQRELDYIIDDVDEWDVEKTFKAFWVASIERRMDEFDFETAFDMFISRAAEKLNQHGMLTWEDFKDNYDISELMGYGDLGHELERLTQRYQNNYMWMRDDYLQEALQHAIYDFLHDTYEDYSEFTDMKELHDKVDSVLLGLKGGVYTMPKSDLAILFDECIHCVHVTGSIWDDIDDIDDLRAEIDEIYEVYA